MSGPFSPSFKEQERLVNFKNSLTLIMKERNIEFTKCPDCNGSGLYGVHTYPTLNAYGEWIEGHSWSGNYCNNCRGVGYINIDDYHIFEKCSWCGGKGVVGVYDSSCSKCVGTGYLLWIDNIVEKKNDEKYY